MSHIIIFPPTPQESAAFYHGYIQLVPGGDLISSLQSQQKQSNHLLSSLPDSKWDYAYQAEKWTIKELLCHVLDTERIFNYRALRIARGDKTPLAGFEQDDYIPFCNTTERTPTSLILEYTSVRQATISLFSNLSKEAMLRIGVASENIISARACGYIIAGHELHHLNILRERYL
jgi:hypothetical protein